MAYYTVKQYRDHMDTNPESFTFDTYYEAEDWIAEEIERRVERYISHTPYSSTQDDIDNIRQIESALVFLVRH